jgi:hypothetical protein
VYNTIKSELVWEGLLDLSENNREDPEKLMFIADNCLNLFARTENNKGVAMYSIFDGTVI